LVVGDQQADFEERWRRVEQLGDALARGQLAGAMLLLDFLGAAASRLVTRNGAKALII
jgi:hypothetical protein